MKRYLIALPIMLLLACGSKQTNDTETEYRDLSISVDTVMVDSKGEILMAAVNGYGAVFSPDMTKLYNWDFESSQVEFVDLNGLKLIEKKPFEKEGPNGVGENSYLMQRYEENQLAFIGWDNRIVIADLSGKVTQRINLDEEWITEDLENRELISFLGFSEDGQKVYCRFTNYQKLDSDLLEIDLVAKKKKIIKLPEFEKLDKFRISFVSENGTSRSMSYPSMNLSDWNGKLLISTNALNSVYRFDSKMDSLELLRYSSQLTANEKTGTYKNEVSSQEEMRSEASKMSEDINFTKLVWDEKNNVFYRFSYFFLPRIADEERVPRTFLSILGPNLQLLGEKEITDLGLGIPNPQFAKDGKLHLFLNLEDELAYIRLTID